MSSAPWVGGGTDEHVVKLCADICCCCCRRRCCCSCSCCCCSDCAAVRNRCLLAHASPLLLHHYVTALQGMYKLAEPKVLVRCREMDVQLVRDAFSAAQVGSAGLFVQSYTVQCCRTIRGVIVGCRRSWCRVPSAPRNREGRRELGCQMSTDRLTGTVPAIPSCVQLNFFCVLPADQVPGGVRHRRPRTGARPQAPAAAATQGGQAARRRVSDVVRLHAAPPGCCCMHHHWRPLLRPPARRGCQCSQPLLRRCSPADSSRALPLPPSPLPAAAAAWW